MAVSIEAINKFYERLRQAQKTKSKEIRLTMEEAQELGTTISQVMARQTELLDKLADLQSTPITIQMGTGGFK